MLSSRPSRLPALLAVLGLALLAAPVLAHPPNPVDRGGHSIGGATHRWLHQAKVPLPQGQVQIIRAACPGHPNFDACVVTRWPKRIYMAVRLSQPRRLLYHELGHVFDLRVLNRSERRAFKRIMGIKRKGWYGGKLPPAEWFADGYERCAFRSRVRSPEVATPYGFRPSVRQHRRVCVLIARAAAPRGRPPQPPKNPPRVVEQPPPPPAELVPGQPCNILDELFTQCSPSGPLSGPPL